ncbi:MFS transporter [Arthrobacter sp. I2-34]|uniref:MFS transporter n=1 Tax=Arthrobacter hankyongi TaxID=2904801 RepID=A0ABS9L9U4_9MICC|nr:MFS transporter [Arthrobacter hankyongi]MCG2623405.1 MFS transporter [Arthrobacter hankyongi]
MPRPWPLKLLPGTDQQAPGRRSPLVSLGVPVYRRFIAAQTLSCLCLWMHRTAHVWLAIQITGGDPLSVGLVTGLQYLPMFLSALGGRLGDRLNKRRLLIASQSIAAAGSLVLGVLAYLGAAPLVWVCIFAVVLGIPAAVDAPVRLAMPRELVVPELLSSAIGINGIVFQVSRVVGPAIAGVCIAAWGVGSGFLLAGVSGALGVAALAALPRGVARAGRGAAATRRSPATRRIRDGAGLIGPIAGAFVVGACLANLQLALPLILTGIPGAGADSFGLLVAMTGLGGAAGAAVAASFRGPAPNGRLHLLLAGFAGLSAVVAVLPSVPALALGVLAAAVFMQAYNTMAISTLQAYTPEGGHGRVMGLYVFCYFIWSGIGTPMFGLASAQIGPRAALGISSGLCLAAVIVLSLRVRRSTPAVPADAPKGTESA